MTFVIGYGIYYTLGWHDDTNAIMFLFPIAIVGGWGARYVYKTITDAKKKS
jgi:hypothetical protein